MEALTTNQVAVMCGVDRTTVGYWVRTGKIQAIRSGKHYQIPVNDLRLFLESSGQTVPEALSLQSNQCLDFPTIQPCWEFFKASQIEGRCAACAAFKNALEPCFTRRRIGSGCCEVKCMDCEYYRKYYLPRMKFVHQIDMPALISKGLYVWGANYPFESMRGFEMGQSIGAGVESIVHRDSMEMVISFAKRRTLGDRCLPTHYSADVRTKENGKIAVQVSVAPLNEPIGTFLAIFDPVEVKP